MAGTMPRTVPELTDVHIRRMRHPGRGRNVTFAVGGVAGLNLQITPSGARSWLLRTVVGDRRREIGLGGYPTVTLGQARARAREALDAIRRGVDPVEERKAAKASLVAARKRGLTFGEALSRYADAKLGEHKDRERWQSMLAIHAAPHIGDMLVQDIAAQDVLRVLQPLWVTKAETARKLRSRIEAVLSWATVAGHRTGDNPARWTGNLKELLPKQTATVVNQPALSLADSPAWFAALRERGGTAARALEFLTLCAARSGEVRGATWQELDLDAGLWTIAARRMKAGREHRVPLTAEAVALLRALPRFEGVTYVFAAPRGGMLSDMTLSAVMRRMQETEEKEGRSGWLDPRSGRPAVPHGLRSTFRDWTAERGYDRDMAEIALAHSVGSDVERAYRRSDMLERRRAMMAAWVAFLGGKERRAEVVQMGARA